ncbi:D-alanyl-D-alanine carboxypeptidase/D-alanyl-D-alanine endopeptidase [Ralstonia nicotianae]|uniref:D-alanyl-D-alanine carboxypeptidase/D-alanyl-D-alanine endopeptidase n=1 Tax=Ralstonia pseudosolanacearum TaxID=1310165 RepID=UPI0005C503D2|nr:MULTISPECIES: D-alanyl-D-alanine carboxypeptidase/D-alanyl-D-alanine-endopeptidase [Ralstonia]QKL52974.1 D-alanyl-D-alanine carboxypeptidase/D-alanyl-D-alanine-endopeptidase [Ralstonia solanacearum]MDO3519056.1 D-alanyl-D-alanine carboxypeptidase/D-alanyl-D-alanine-endopeptidase [Ralstonia pseudosolanacearum]MDO3543282.1 D-alanyl-D-alanine carboxypeptidase/D-alanyl-D-alanine-endopeptidase [Ralstonia pseudosolanacearum]OAI71675.1 D-alanyl-D-alanine carboxypeptidase [Ralstonia pseudosolanacear
MARIIRLTRLLRLSRCAVACAALLALTAAPLAQARKPARAHAAPAAAVVQKRQAAHNPAGLPANVALAFARAHIPLDAVSVFVIRTGTATPILQWNADAGMNPASTMKLLTTFAGLDLLGPDFRWKTSAYADRPPAGGVLNGNLYLRGQGDPKLIPEELIKLVTDVRRAGVDELAGNIVLDRSYFENGLSDAPPLDGDTGRAYNVAPDALLYAFKTLTFTLAPDAATGAVNVDVSPPLAQLQVDNQLHVTHGNCGDWRSHANFDIATQADGTVRASFDGRYAGACGERIFNVAALTHADFIWGGFLALWRQAGGTFRATPGLREGKVPHPAVLLATHYGPTLAEVVHDIDKYSNNVMARQLFLTIGAEIGRKPASVQQSADIISRWLARQNLSMPELVLENGSGLSRIERISARNLGRLLQQADANPNGAILRDALPVVGVDGTMRNRLTRAGVAGNAEIKTGTLNDVRAIAGYVEGEGGQRYVVVSMINHPNAGGGQAAHDALLQWIYQGAPQ